MRFKPVSSEIRVPACKLELRLRCLTYWIRTEISLNAIPDNQLIQQSINGDTQAFSALITRYQDRLVHSLEHALGSREDALDAAQQAFVSVWQKLDTFRQDSAFYSWLYRVALNAAISGRRKQRLSTTSLESYVESSGTGAVDGNADADPTRQLASAENVRLVREALLQVAEEFRQPLVLKEMDGFSYEEIAKILEIPIGTVRSRIFRARREITERLHRLFEE